MWLLLVQPLLGTWPTTQAYALTGNQTGDPLVCRPVLNPLSYTRQNHLVFLYKFTLKSLVSLIHDYLFIMPFITVLIYLFIQNIFISFFNLLFFNYTCPTFFSIAHSSPISPHNPTVNPQHFPCP